MNKISPISILSEEERFEELQLTTQLIVNEICIIHNLPLPKIEYGDYDYHKMCSTLNKETSIREYTLQIRKKFWYNTESMLESIKLFELNDIYESYNIKLNLILYYVFTLLHELGHLYNNHYIYTNIKLNVINKKRMNDIISNTIKLTFPKPTTIFDYVYMYHYNPSEQAANIFAYQNLHRAINILKRNNLL